MLETALITLFALMLGCLLAQLALPFLRQLLQKPISMGELYTPSSLLFLFSTWVTIVVLAGFYPAIILSGFNPIEAIKSKITARTIGGVSLRKGLVVFQFTISVTLILGAIVIGSQLAFMKKQDLGFKKDQQLILPLSSKEIAENYIALKGELDKTAGISSVTCGSTYPGIQNINDMLFYSEGRAATDNIDISTASIEDEYFETLGLKLLYGRTFSRNSRADSTNLILNETAVKQLGYEPATAVGRKVNYDWHGTHNSMQIVGVVKDFNFESLHNPIRPFAFSINELFANKHVYTIVRLQTGDYPRVLAAVEKAWNKVNPSAPFEYSFLDQDFQRNYEKEQRTSNLVIYCTSIAILIACLGLFGLAAFSAERRTREIGIRKVLGASVTNVTLLLSGEFIRLALLAILIASPLAWFGMHRWLQNFAYRISISWWMFAEAGGIALIIALITVSSQSIRTALSNPIKNLRTE